MRIVFICILFISCQKFTEYIPHDSKQMNLAIDTVNIPYYFFGGQSNMGECQWPGKGTTGPIATAQQLSDYGHVLTNFHFFNKSIDFNKYHDLNPGKNTRLYDSDSTTMGCETSFLNSVKNNGVQSAFATKIGIGGMPMEKFWAVGYSGNTQVKQAIDQSLKLAVAMGKKPVFKAFIWMQGESDSRDSTSAAHYYNNLVTFFHDFSSWLASEQIKYGLPVDTSYKKVIGRINFPSGTYRNVIRTAQLNFCLLNHPSTIIDTDTYPRFDGTHYTIDGQIKFGLDIYNQIK